MELPERKAAKLKKNNQPMQLKIEKTRLSDRDFVQCCFIFREGVVGDFEQRMLLGNFKLAVADLILRLKNLPLHDFKSAGKISEIFRGMSSASLKRNFYLFQKIPEFSAFQSESNIFSAIPMAIEAFDGEEAYLFMFEGQWRFSWRQWDTKKINFTPLNRDAFIEILKLALAE